jgi:hypothetical protein
VGVFEKVKFDESLVVNVQYHKTVDSKLDGPDPKRVASFRGSSEREKARMCCVANEHER